MQIFIWRYLCVSFTFTNVVYVLVFSVYFSFPVKSVWIANHNKTKWITHLRLAVKTETISLNLLILTLSLIILEVSKISSKLPTFMSNRLIWPRWHELLLWLSELKGKMQCFSQVFPWWFRLLILSCQMRFDVAIVLTMPVPTVYLPNTRRTISA